MEYNQKSVDAIEKFEIAIGSRLEPTLALHMKGILNAIELQIEEGKEKKPVVAILFSAISELIKSCPDQEQASLLKAMAQCESVVMRNNNTTNRRTRF